MGSESEAVFQWVGSGLRMIPISLFPLFSALTLASRLAAVRGFHLEEIEREEGEEWNYSDKGPDTWGARFSTCRGDRQSPINIQGDWMTPEHPLQIQLMNTSIGDSGRVKMENDGTTMRMSLVNTSSLPLLSGGDLVHAYTFAQAHFHWGANNNRGSEHQIDRIVMPMEIHLVHYKASLPSFEAAVAEDLPDSLAVVGIFFEVSDLDEELDFSETVEQMKKLENAGSSTEFRPNQAFPFLKNLDLSSLYRYQGSLTTPTCNQIIEWIVVRRPLKIGKGQMKVFRRLRDRSGHTLVDNFRPVRVWKSKSGSNKLQITAASSILLLLVFNLFLL